MCRAASLVKANGFQLRVAGSTQPSSLHAQMQTLGPRNLRMEGSLDRRGVADLLGAVRLGLVVLHPTPSYVNAVPVKLFEYMSAAIPVVASDFPLWREIVDGAGCGLLVDPTSPHAIAEAINWLLEHPQEAEAMGRRGREAVEQRYNWENESKTLLALYEELLA